jgi:hypothetical protein
MAHTTSLRLPDDLFEEAKPIVQRRGGSFNSFVEHLLRREIAAEQEREMVEAARLLASDAEANVDFAFAAQSEVALGDRTGHERNHTSAGA